MKVQDVVNRKGSTVITMRSDEPVAALVSLLHQHRIGAVVVSDESGHVHGIASERDVVRGLAESGPAVLDLPVSAVMTEQVHSCAGAEDLATIAERMTNHRIRHLPVMHGDRLQAIISIGDVVKSRLDELTDERNQLITYVQG